MIKGLYQRFRGGEEDSGSNEDEPIEYSLDPEEFKNNDKVEFGDITPGEQLGLIIRNLPDTIRQFSEKKDESPVELYFLIYSLITTALMIGSIFFLNMYVTLGIAVVYGVTAVPILYAYEETGMFEENTG